LVTFVSITFVSIAPASAGAFFSRPLTRNPGNSFELLALRIQYQRRRSPPLAIGGSQRESNVWMRTMEARTIKPHEKALAELKLHVVRQRVLAAALVRQGSP
jgi:hypothetical protein